MSDTDSFIDEVSEEVRRDRLYGLIKRYGWIALAVVLVIVGGAAWNEYRTSSAEAEAQAFGDALLAALEAEGPEARRQALDGVEAEGARAALVAMLAAQGSDGATADPEPLRAVMANAELPQLYRDLAALKLAMALQGQGEPAEIKELLQPLIVPGAPFRVLAEEQLALAEVAGGETDAAIQRLTALRGDNEASQALRQRAAQLIVALGGSLDEA